MAVTATPALPQKPNRGLLQLTNANAAGTFVTVYTGGANGSKIVGLIGEASDTVAHDLQIAVVSGGTTYVLGTASLPIGAGNTSSVPSVNMFTAAQLPGLPIDSDGNPYIFLASTSDTLAINPVVIVSSGKAVNVTCIGADF